MKHPQWIRQLLIRSMALWPLLACSSLLAQGEKEAAEPAPATDELPLTVLSVRDSVPPLWMPPPLEPDELPLTVLLARVSVPKLRMPPP